MSNFTPQELEYLGKQRLGRLATVNTDGHPQIAPVGFRYNPDLDTIDIGGRNFGQSKKFRNILQNPHVAFVIDDVLPPWIPRCVEIRGVAEPVTTGGKALFGANYDADDAMIHIHPTQIISFGLDGEWASISNRKIAQSY
jgi:pyridoxamine 5'-phosphate oxidase family protein